MIDFNFKLYRDISSMWGWKKGIKPQERYRGGKKTTDDNNKKIKSQHETTTNERKKSN